MNGNLTGDGSTTYGYDVENRLTAKSGGVSLVYDPLGRLFQVSGGASGTTQFLYDGDQLVMEYDGSGTILRRYVHGPGEDDPYVWFEGSSIARAAQRFLYPDSQGSVVGIGDLTGSGARFGINSYDEYGIPASGNVGRFQYTGQAWLPDLGLYYYKARMYWPGGGRFLQTDPIGYADQNNLYTYVANDPMNRTDPTGKQNVGEANDQDARDYLAGRITEAQYKERMQARAEGGLFALSFLPVGRVLEGFAWLGRAIGIGSKAEKAAVFIEAGQFGAKAASHMSEFGLDVSKATDRQAFKGIIQTITSKADTVVNGTFAGQGANGARGAVKFFIKGADVVVTKPNGQFVTILKNGIENSSVKRALEL